MNKWTNGFVESATGRIAYNRTGRDLPPLLLAHGLTDSGLCWTRVARALEQDFDIIMLDARGHGCSARIGQDDRDDHGADIAVVIKALKLNRPAVMGHSVGARTVAMFANQFPELVSKVILEDPPFRDMSSTSNRESRINAFRKQIEKFSSMKLEELVALGRKDYPKWHPDEIDAWAASKQQVDAEVMAWYDFTPWRQTIDHIASPTLLIYGEAEKGGIVSKEIVEQACEINQHISASQIEGAGHNIHREQFDEYITVVRKFLL